MIDVNVNQVIINQMEHAFIFNVQLIKDGIMI